MICEFKFGLNTIVDFTIDSSDFLNFGIVPAFNKTGIIVGAKFTQTKILYDILDNTENNVSYNINENDIKIHELNLGV